MNVYLILSIVLFSIFTAAGQQSFHDGDMHIEWKFSDSLIIFSITTPTNGWQAIGFNEKGSLENTYLIMSRVTAEGKGEVVEHYVESPGQYSSLNEYGIVQRIQVINAKENGKQTIVTFSLPCKAGFKLHKTLQSGMRYTMHYAYSMDDDFQHHSIFRRKTKIIL